MIGSVRLEDDAPGAWASARPPGDLRQQLERPLRGAIVGQVEGHVGGDDGGQRDRRQVEPLRHELCAHQHVGAAVPEVIVDRFECAPRCQGVAVQTCDAEAWESVSNLGLHALRPRTKVPNSRRTAVWAPLRHCSATPAMVTAEIALREMEDEGQVTVGAPQALATVAAQDEGGRATAVDEQDALPTVGAKAGHRLDQGA